MLVQNLARGFVRLIRLETFNSRFWITSQTARELSDGDEAANSQTLLSSLLFIRVLVELLTCTLISLMEIDVVLRVPVAVYVLYSGIVPVNCS